MLAPFRRCPSIPEPYPCDNSADPLAQSALADLERSLEVLIGGGEQRSCEKMRDKQIEVGKRIEADLRRFFGEKIWQGMPSGTASSGSGAMVLAADRLFVAFLGRSAGMAITRKLYSDQE